MPALREMVLHLAKREVDSQHRMTLLGWTWPLVRQLAQLAVLVFIFSAVLDLGIDNYAVFVFTGLVAWTWFASGIAGAAGCLRSQRPLVFQPRFPTLVVPLVAVAVPFVDVLLALPVLALMLLLTDGLPLTALLLPLVLGVQVVLMAGVAWFVAATAVYFRDVQNVVAVALTLLFYMTPVFYGLRVVPDEYHWALYANPLATLLEAHRALLLGEPFPDALRVAAVVVASLAVAVAGYLTFRRLEPDFVDHL